MLLVLINARLAGKPLLEISGWIVGAHTCLFAVYQIATGSGRLICMHMPHAQGLCRRWQQQALDKDCRSGLSVLLHNICIEMPLYLCGCSPYVHADV